MLRQSLRLLRRFRQPQPRVDATGKGDRSETQLPGPPAIAFARQAFAGRADIVIDPLETEFVVRSAGVAVRAWVVLPTAELPEDMLRSITETATKLADLPPQTRRIFFLATAYRLTTRQICARLDLGNRSVTRQLLRAIAHLDGRSL